MSSNRKYAVEALAEKGEVIIRGAGGSMRPIMDTGDSLYLKKVDSKQLRVGDAVFCRVSGNLFVHKITAIDEPEQRFQISNNSGHVNGWVGSHCIFGLCYRVNDKFLVTPEQLDARK